MRGIPGMKPLALAPDPAGAGTGGFRVQGRVAAVYDAAIVEQARKRKHHIAFFAIEGTLVPRTLRAIEAYAESTFGVDKGSARISVENASLSLAFDPQRVAFAAIQAILERKLAAIRLTLLPMRVLEET